MSIASTSIGRRARHRHRRVSAPVAAAVLGIIALAVWAFAHTGGSGVVTQTRSVAPFSAVELTGSNLIFVRVGAQQSVAVHAHVNMLDRVATRVRGGTLVVADAPSLHTTKGPISVSVTVPTLRSLTIARTGSGIVAVTGVDAPSLTVTLAGSGVVRATGSVTRLNVSLGGSGDAELGHLVARSARAVVSGSGRIDVTATSSLDASVSGSGAIMYSGYPARLATSVTGSGVIIPTPANAAG